MADSPSKEDIARLAYAIVKTGGNALLIAANNRRTGPNGAAEWVAIPEAIAHSRAFAVEPRPGLLALDVDADRGDHTWADVVVPQVRARGCAVVRVASGRPGHEHVWLNAPVGWSTEDLRKSVLEAGAPAGQVRINATRPPLSRHRLGDHGQLLDPLIVDEAVQRLGRRPLMLDLTLEALELLRCGDVTGKYRHRGKPSREYMIQALIVWWVQAALPFEDLLERLRDPANVAGEKIRDKAFDDGRAWLARKWDDGREFVRDNPRRPTLQVEGERLAQVLSTVQTHAWGGRTGVTDRAVYAALAAICAEHLSRPVLRCSHRRLAEITGVSRKTVARSLQRLRKAGLVTVELEHVGLAATDWRLHPERLACDPSNLSLLRGDREGTTGVSSTTFDGSRPDAFRTRHGLTAGAWQTFSAMPVDLWIKTNQLRELRPYGPTLPTLRSHLVALLSAGFVDHDDSRKQYWKRSPHADVERYARVMGLAGSTERQRELNEAERAAWAFRSGQPRPA